MAHYLTTAVESVLDQTYQDYELIVIDDGSTDDTPELASGFPVKVRYVRQENQGLSAVRNRGIELACGEYIIFLDADDVLAPGKLETQVKVLERTGADVAYGDWQEVVQGDDGQFVPRNHIPTGTVPLDG